MFGSNLAELALCPDPCQTGDGHRLAPKGIPLTLEMEIAAWAWRWPQGGGRDSRTDSPDEPRQPLWGALRIHGERLKLGIDIGATSVSKYMVRGAQPPSQTWRTFLENHRKSVVSVDFFTVPTIAFQVLYVFLVLAHHRRRILPVLISPSW